MALLHTAPYFCAHVIEAALCSDGRQYVGLLNNRNFNYNTKLSQGLHIWGTKTFHGQKCIQYKGSSLWNISQVVLFCCCTEKY